MSPSKSSPLIGALVLVLFLPGTSLASAVTLPFQGYLDLDGVPCQGSFGLGFRLENEEGQAIGRELRRQVAIEAGHFVANLEFPAESFSGDTKAFLRVTIYEPDGFGGETARPLINRQRLMPALSSHSAETGQSFQVEEMHSAVPQDKPSITVHSDLDLPASDLNVGGDVEVGANLDVDGDMSVEGSATVEDDLAVGGTATAWRMEPSFISEWRHLDSSEVNGWEHWTHGLGSVPRFYVLQACSATSDGPTGECTGITWILTKGSWGKQNGGNWLYNPAFIQADSERVSALYAEGVRMAHPLVPIVTPVPPNRAYFRVLAWR